MSLSRGVISHTPAATFQSCSHPTVSRFIPQGLGWIPDLPDPRDYTYRHPDVRSLLLRLASSRQKEIPAEVDLRQDEEGEYLASADDQGSLNCSTSFAVLGLVEYFERRVRARTFEGSRLFLYKVTRNRLHKTRRAAAAAPEHLYYVGDTGADFRTTLKVLTSTGVPPEEYWSFDIATFDQEPDQFLYTLAKPPTGVM